MSAYAMKHIEIVLLWIDFYTFCDVPLYFFVNKKYSLLQYNFLSTIVLE